MALITSDRVPFSCWWRLVSTSRVVNSSCVNNNVVQGVLAHNPGCWQRCAQPNNASSACWIECLFETMVGDAAGSGARSETPVSGHLLLLPPADCCPMFASRATQGPSP